MSLIIVIGLLGVILVVILKRPIIAMRGNHNRLVGKLQQAKWFENHWLAGMFLFLLNAVLFALTYLLLSVLMFFFIPFMHFVVMAFAVIGSMVLWLVIHKAWEGSNKDRLKLGALGSSFYMLLTLVFVYWLVTLKPSFPGDDSFMKAVGLVIAIIVTAVAGMTCFTITGLSIRENRDKARA